MIYRKILKTKIVDKDGLREPDLKLPKGINLVVLEYGDDYAVVECWCSDHEILEPNERKTDADLEILSNNPSVIQKLQSHPKSPPLLATMSISRSKNPGFNVDKNIKKLTVKSRTVSYIRMKTHSPHGKEEELYILDEG